MVFSSLGTMDIKMNQKWRAHYPHQLPLTLIQHLIYILLSVISLSSIPDELSESLGSVFYPRDIYLPLTPVTHGQNTDHAIQ